MPRTLNDVRKLAAEVAREVNPALNVVGTMSAEGAADYAEVVVTQRYADAEPRRSIIGVSRDAPEAEQRTQVRERLRAEFDIR